MPQLRNKLKERIALLRIKKGDTEAFGFLYDVYVERIHRYIRFRVPDIETTQDLTHEVFLETWEYILKNQGVGNLQAFLYKVAYHKVVDFYRRRERQAMLLKDVPDEELSAGGSQEVDAEMQLLLRHVRNLKDEYQDVVILRHVEGLTIGEIAQILSKNENVVRVTLHRAMETLRKFYQS